MCKSANENHNFLYLCNFMDENIDIQSLVQKYEQMCASGKKIYFDPEEFALLAEHYNAVGDDEKSINLIEEGLAIHPTNPDLMLLRAKVLVFDEQFEEALEYIKNIADENDTDVVLLKIESYLHLNRHNEAAKLVNETFDYLSADVSNQEEFYYFICELGYLYNDVDQYDNAIQLLTRSLDFEKGNTEVLVDLAFAYEMKYDYEKAIEYNNQLLDIDPYSFDAWINIGKLYSVIDQFDKAIDAFDFALTIKENDLQVLKMKGLVLFLSGNSQEAVRLLESCLIGTSDDETVYNSLLEAYAAMEQYDEMLKLLQKKEELFGPAGIAIKRTFVFLAKENLPVAKAFFKQVPENEKDTFDYYMMEGELAFYEANYDCAEKAYLKAVAISEDNEDVLDRLANVCVAQEKFHQAAHYLQQVVAIAPDFPSAKMRLAFLLFEIGDQEPFVEIIDQFADEELFSLFNMIEGKEQTEVPKTFNRVKMLALLNEARENRVHYKNLKY